MKKNCIGIENMEFYSVVKIAKEFDQIIFIWVNYKESFEKWVKENGWNIITSLPENIENTVLLFEGKKAWKTMEKLMLKFQSK